MNRCEADRRRATTGETEERLVDEMIQRYVEWREECDGVRAAHDWWTGSPISERRTSCAVYAAALDREASAADEFAAALGRLKRCLWPDAGRIAGSAVTSDPGSGREHSLSSIRQSIRR